MARLDATLDLWRAAGEQHWFAVSGSSMLPLIADGDRVLVALSGTGVRRGDLVLLRRGTQLLVHRAIEVRGGPHRREDATRLVTKGDNLIEIDAPGAARDLVGRVLAVENRGRSYRVDGRAWRVLGRCIAGGAWVWDRLYRPARRCKRRLFGARPFRLVGWLRTVLHAAQGRILCAARRLLMGGRG